MLDKLQSLNTKNNNIFMTPNPLTKVENGVVHIILIYIEYVPLPVRLISYKKLLYVTSVHQQNIPEKPTVK